MLGLLISLVDHGVVGNGVVGNSVVGNGVVGHRGVVGNGAAGKGCEGNLGISLGLGGSQDSGEEGSNGECLKIKF